MGNSRNREKPSRDKLKSEENIDAKSAAEPAVRFYSRNADLARYWLLPTAEGDAWVVGDESQPAELLRKLIATSPNILVPRLKAEEENEARSYAGAEAQRSFRECFHSALFGISTRLLISFAWLLAAGIGLRLPGEVKFVDEFLLLAGMGFCGYSIIRYGVPALRWQNAVTAAPKMLEKAELKHDPLLDRLADALRLRKTLRSDERGKSPDAELLDANAYRKLIADGVTTAEEFSALGEAIRKSLCMDAVENPPRKFADIARDCGLDLESAIFYRDLAAAARELKLEHELCDQ